MSAVEENHESVGAIDESTSPTEKTADPETVEVTEERTSEDRVEPTADGADEKDTTAAEPTKAGKKTRKSEPQLSASKTDDESGGSFKAGDSVVVKIQGYPWWPAVIVTEDHFPAPALAARPSVKTRKDGTSTVFHPVQFLGSPEYYWSRPTDIKALSLEDIKAWIESGKKSVSKGLKAAYQEAATSPTLEGLMKAKKDAESLAVDEDEEMADEYDAVPEDAESEDIELDDEGKPIKKSKRKASRTPKKTPTKNPTKKRKTDDTGPDAPSSSKKSKTPKGNARARRVMSPASPEPTPEEAAKLQHDQKVKSVMFIRHKLQKCLLGAECEVKMLPDVPGYLEKLEKVDVDVQLFRDTKIAKVLLRINKLEKIPEDDDHKIRQHVSKLLEKWQETMELQKKKDDEDAQARAAPQSPMPEPTVTEEPKSEVKDEAPTAATNGHSEETTNGESKDTTVARTETGTPVESKTE